MPAPLNILVCPLDWGIGHASRMIPLIDELIARKHQVIIAADNYPLALLRQRFHTLPYIRFSSFTISYGKGNALIYQLLLAAPKIAYHIYKEHVKLRSIIKKFDINLIVSDNRYGLWSKSTPSVFITHQLNIKTPKLLRPFDFILRKTIHYFISKYDLCLIPDNITENSFSGNLAYLYEIPNNCIPTGILSRFSLNIPPTKQHIKYNVLAILSGPEPQRTELEEIIIEKYKNKKELVLIVAGQPTNEIQQNTIATNIHRTNHLTDKELKAYIQTTPIVICRSGYSSIMDFATLNIHAILIPTSGQSEQEYLAKRMKAKKWFHTIHQSQLLYTDISTLKYSSLDHFPETDNTLFFDAVDNMIKLCYTKC